MHSYVVGLVWGPFLEWQGSTHALNSSFQLSGGGGRAMSPAYSACPFLTTLLGYAINVLHSLSSQGQSSSHSRSLGGRNRPPTLLETNQFNGLQPGALAEVGTGQQAHPAGRKRGMVGYVLKDGFFPTCSVAKRPCHFLIPSS